MQPSNTLKAVLGLGLFALVLVLVTPHIPTGEREEEEGASPRLRTLERLMEDARPGSPEAVALERKIKKAGGEEHEAPGFDEPQEFVRILTGMKTPPGREHPEYAPGYRHRELVKALRAKGDLRQRFQAKGTASAEATLPWISRGPGNVAGRARGIVVDPDDATNQTWFIGTVGGGVWKTTDGGATWQWLTPDFPVLAAQSIAMAPSDHDVLYVGTGESFYNVDTINGDGILKSIDRGATWTQLASTAGNPAFNNVARIIVDPTDPDVVLAAVTTGFYKTGIYSNSSIMKSTDGGTNWTEVYTAASPVRVQQLVSDPTDFDVLYATAATAGILKSTDRGDTWAPSNTGITDFTGRFELAVSPVDHNLLFAAAEGASPHPSKLWMSTDGGATWVLTNPVGGDPNWLNGQGWYDNTLVCHPTDPDVVYVGGVYLYKVTLSGTDRTTVYLNPGVHVDNHGLEIIAAPGGWRILNTSDGGVAVSTLGDAGWSQVTDGLVTTQFYGVDKRPGASAYLGGTQDNGTWQSPEDPTALTPWTPVIGGDGYETSWDFDDPLKLIGGYQYNGLMRSLDGGLTWSSAIGSMENGAGNAPFITKIAKSQIDPELLFTVGKSGVWRSTNFGGSWSLSSIPSGTWGSMSSFHDIRISRADPGVVWAGAYMGASGQIQLSTDGGLTFNPVPSYTTVTMNRISGLATHPTDSNTAYVLFSYAAKPKILRTTDGGLNWEDLTGFESGSPSTNGFPDVAVYDLVVFSDDTDHMWAATEIGLVESLDGGASWALADNGLPNVAVWRLTEVEDEVVAGTHGRGIWSVALPGLLAGKSFKPLIEALYQGPDGMLGVDMNLRSAYDSTQVWVDAAVVSTIGANTPLQKESVQVPVLAAGTKSVHLDAYQAGNVLSSVTRSIDVYLPKEPVDTYLNDFESPTADFTGSLFRIGTQAGFTGSAIHSPHPYADGSSGIYDLTVPIRVAGGNANLEYDEIALIEPGEPGSVYGDPDFWDYVVVEGTQDGSTWVPLLPGYDCRAYKYWYDSFPYSVSPSLFRHRTIDLHDTFAAGDTVLVRFRLSADGAVHGWGWVIDNLNIQAGVQTGVEDGGRPLRLTLAQSTPNPFRSRTAIRFVLPEAGEASLEIFDVQGRLVRILVSGPQGAGEHEATWDGRGASGQRAAAGTYFYLLRTPQKTLRQKLVLLR